MIELTKISLCRLCNSNKLLKIIDFKKIAIGNNLISSFGLSKKVKKYPLILNKCLNCNHFQLGHSISSKILFKKNYTYLSGIGNTFVNHFDKYSNWINKYISSSKNLKPKVIDIGSNDGTCLKSFKKKGYITIGIDPAKLPSKIAIKDKIKTYNLFFNKKNKDLIKSKHGLFDLVTSHNVLAHTENINEIFDSIFDLLKMNGFFCFEVGYFYEVLKNNFFDTIYHEHLDYHHANPLLNFLNQKGFSIINISTNNIQGGTIRFLCKKLKNVCNSKQVIKFVNLEKKTILFDKKFHTNWNKNINQIMNDFNNLVNLEIKKNKYIVGYGAPTKIVLLLSISKLNVKRIQYLIEDNHLKTNKYLPTTGILIKDIKDIKYSKNNIPEIVILFAWNFSNDIIRKLKKYFKKDIEVIIPLPKPVKIKIC